MTIKATLKTWGGLERKSWEKKTAKEKANNNVNKQTNKHKYFLKIPMCTLFPYTWGLMDAGQLKQFSTLFFLDSIKLTSIVDDIFQAKSHNN